MNGKSAKHTRRTHQNHVKISIRSFQNHRNSSKTRKITEETSTKFQSTISSDPNCGQDVKNTKKSKRYISNAPKAAYLSKNHVLEPRKICRNREFPVKKGEKCTVKIPNTFGERINTVLKSVSYCSKITETRSKPEKSPKRHQRNSKVP